MLIRFSLFFILLWESFAFARASLPPHLNPGYRQPRYISRASLEWSELELSSVYKTTADIYYNDSRGSFLLYPKASAFRLNQIIPIPQISTIYFELINQNCTNPNLKLDIFLYENVVLTVEPSCVLGVYVEAKDYYYPSFFEGSRRKRN